MRALYSTILLLISISVTKAYANTPDFVFESVKQINHNLFQYQNPKVVINDIELSLWGTGGIFFDGTLPASAYPRHLTGICISLLGPNSKYKGHAINPKTPKNDFGAIVLNMNNSDVEFYLSSRFEDHPYKEPTGTNQNFAISIITCIRK